MSDTADMDKLVDVVHYVVQVLAGEDAAEEWIHESVFQGMARDMRELAKRRGTPAARFRALTKTQREEFAHDGGDNAANAGGLAHLGGRGA